MVKATIASKSAHHAKLQRVVAAKTTKMHSGAAHPVADNSTVKIPFTSTSHTPRTIRLANDPNRHRTRPPVVIKAAVARQAKARGFYGAIVPRAARSMQVYEEPVPCKIFMDYGGHCHSRLDDGGYLFMDQFGHCHSRLDDGGYLYMDPLGHVHDSLNDQAPTQSAPHRTVPNLQAHVHHLYMDSQGHAHTSLTDHTPQAVLPHGVPNLRVHHPVPRSINHRSQDLVAMLGDVSISQKSRSEQMAHDRELHTLQSKMMKPPSHAARRDCKTNRSSRRSRSIDQPRKLS